jgi:outer membrane protein OmpA-like peptidoglycan-associated protein
MGTLLAARFTKPSRRYWTMATNLIDTIRGVITPDASNKAATELGESSADTHRGLQAAVPTILAGLAHRVSTPDGASTVHNMLNESAASGSVEKISGGGNPRELEDQGRGLVDKIFGGRSGSVGEALARSSGIKSESATRILSLAAPLVMGVLGKEVASRGVSAGGLSQLFSSHKKAIVEDPHLPSGVAGALGQRDLSEVGRTAAPTGEQRMNATERPSRFAHERERFGHEREHAVASARRSPWRFILPALAAVGLAIWGITAALQSNPSRMGVTAPQPTLPPGPSAPQAAPGAPGQNAAPTAGVDLPGGKKLDVPANGPAADLAHTIADPTVPLPRTFQFSALRFDPGSTTLAADASQTMDPVARILESYPTARVKIGGISETRARAVKGMLVAKGASADQIDTTGQGQTVPTSESERENRPAEIVLVHR